MQKLTAKSRKRTWIFKNSDLMISLRIACRQVHRTTQRVHQRRVESQKSYQIKSHHLYNRRKERTLQKLFIRSRVTSPPPPQRANKRIKLGKGGDRPGLAIMFLINNTVSNPETLEKIAMHRDVVVRKRLWKKIDLLFTLFLDLSRWMIWIHFINKEKAIFCKINIPYF